MEKTPISIFNDVLGPVMRGPSSSHVAGAARIAALVRQSFNSKIKKAICDFDVNGSLAASHTGHGSDMGFACGLLGIDLASPAVDDFQAAVDAADLEIEYRILDYGAIHPGNYRMQVWDQNGFCRIWEAISTGGGMIEMQKLDGMTVNICGNFYELLIYCQKGHKTAEECQMDISKIIPEYDYCLTASNEDTILINIKLAKEPADDCIEKIKNLDGITDAFLLAPILPTHSRKGCTVPFSTAEELLVYAADNKMAAWDYAIEYESRCGDVSREKVFAQMDDILTIMEASVDTGLAGTKYRDRILGVQSQKIEEAQREKRLIPDPLINEMINSITAVMECKSSMGVIVAAPTCGSCGCLPGTVIGLGRYLKLPREQMVQGLLTAGLVGAIFAGEATFSAEVAGCQVECGAGSCMAAAAVTAMMGGSIENCIDAASVALQNITGLACDPVGNRVEVPCLGKNIMGGTNAISSANMILAGYNKVIPLDETIKAIYQIGLSLPLELRCTFGGLGMTNTARKIFKKTAVHFEGEPEK